MVSREKENRKEVRDLVRFVEEQVVQTKEWVAKVAGADVSFWKSRTNVEKWKMLDEPEEENRIVDDRGSGEEAARCERQTTRADQEEVSEERRRKLESSGESDCRKLNSVEVRKTTFSVCRRRWRKPISGGSRHRVR
jgi:hypothetical protein